MEILNSLASFLCPVVAIRLVRDNNQMRPPGIEPGLEAWEATVIPLDHGRILLYFFMFRSHRAGGKWDTPSRGVTRAVYTTPYIFQFFNLFLR